MQITDDSQPYQAPLGWVAHALQEPLREEAERLKKQQIVVSLGVDEIFEWYGTTVFLVPKANDKVQLYLDPARLTKH